MKNRFVFLSILYLASGCTRHSSSDDGVVSCMIAQRIDEQARWNQGCCPEIDESIQSLIERELTPETAIQIAFLKNPLVQSIYEELGVSHADLVAAGLLTNPNFSLETRYPQSQGYVTNIEYLVTTAFLDIFMIPLRTKLAEAEFEQAKIRVANEILNLAFDVRQTYYELVGSRQKFRDTIRPIVELESIQEEIVARQNTIGNVNPLDFQQIQARSLEVKIEAAKEQTSIIRYREKLNRLMGLHEEVCLILPDLPQDLDYNGFDLCALESIALHERLDLQEARFEVIRLCRKLGIKQWWAYTNLQAGLAGERDGDGLNTIGFGLTGEIPIFNYGQADRLRIVALLRQAEQRYYELEIRVLSEVREAHRLLILYLDMLNDYRSRLIPMHLEIINSSEELYNVMGLGVDRLLTNKRIQLEAQQSYLEIVKDYWVVRVQLDKALGGYLFRLYQNKLSYTKGGME